MTLGDKDPWQSYICRLFQLCAPISRLALAKAEPAKGDLLITLQDLGAIVLGEQPRMCSEGP